MAAWTEEELGRIGAADELEIAPVRCDGTLRPPRPIWVVRAGDGLYVRAAYGPGSGWHRVARTSGRARISAGGVEKDVTVEDADDAALDQVDAAYREKYDRRYASIVDSITDEEHRATTLRLLPRGEGDHTLRDPQRSGRESEQLSTLHETASTPAFSSRRASRPHRPRTSFARWLSLKAAGRRRVRPDSDRTRVLVLRIGPGIWAG